MNYLRLTFHLQIFTAAVSFSVSLSGENQMCMLIFYVFILQIILSCLNSRIKVASRKFSLRSLFKMQSRYFQINCSSMIHHISLKLH